MIYQKTMLVLRLALIGIAVLGLGCTENPFDDGKVELQGNTLSGQVILLDGARPDSVVVWLEGFDLLTRTDANGEFSLDLPVPGSTGLSGVFKVYFYIANYKLETANLVLINSRFDASSGDFDGKGRLRQPVTLLNRLTISTRVTPASVFTNYDSMVVADVQLVSVLDPVTVVLPKTTGGLLTGAFLRKLDDGEIYLLNTGGNTRLVYVISDTARKTIRMHFDFASQELPVGNYELIPYLLAENDAVPQGLLDHLGKGIRLFTKKYLRLPFKRDGGGFRVQKLR